MERTEAIKILKEFHDKSALFSVRTALETALPELAESKDERIRKHIISVLEGCWQTCKNIGYDSSRIQEDIDWLEKQGEQKISWKPSDDQMHSLKQAIDSYTFEPDYLEELYEDLKELKGE